jgi:hypothetical protein
MKKFGYQQPLGQPALFIGLIAVVGALALDGCSKANTTSTTEAPPLQDVTQADTNQSVAAPNSNPNVVPTQAAVTAPQPDLAALQRSLAGWLVANRRAPANFEEFAATANVTIPPPPPGKKYYLTNRMRIELVDINSNP